MKKRWYFVLRKGTGKTSVDMYMYIHNNRFKVDHQLHDKYLFNWFQAQFIMLLFKLPKWIKRNGNLFSYFHVSGTVHLKKLEQYMLK